MRNRDKKKQSGVYRKMTASAAAPCMEQRVTLVETRPMLASLLEVIEAQRARARDARVSRKSA